MLELINEFSKFNNVRSISIFFLCTNKLVSERESKNIIPFKNTSDRKPSDWEQGGD